LIDKNTKNKETINPTKPVQNFKYEFSFNLLTSTAVETLTFILLKNMVYFDNISFSDIIYFIPKSFIFEIIFDFFHYWAHRLLHTYPALYINIHKKHHKFKYPTSIITFYQEPVDLILTNTIPQFLTLLVLPRTSLFQYMITLSFKEFIEISGHCGKRTYPNCSFSQFIEQQSQVVIAAHVIRIFGK
jgi:sterol desaturase/sphingolipid hydroxylase (fatty acid hydroxylase superfamily)